MKAFSNSIVSTVINFIWWLFPNFFKERKGAKFLIPIPVQNRIRSKFNILIIPMICSVMYHGKATANIIATENKSVSKVSFTNAPTRMRPTVFKSLIANLYANVNNVYILADGNMVLFDDAYSNAVDGSDARKLTNMGENFGMIRDNVVLAVEKRKSMLNSDTVFFEMSNLRSIPYKLEIQASNLNHPGMVGFLEDAFLNTRVPLSLTETTRYLFNVTATAGSSAKNRFRAIFFTLSAAPLPVNFVSINTQKILNKTVVNWQVSNQINIKEYKVQSSLNGTSFATIGTTTGLTNSNLSATYQWTDEATNTGLKYYRIMSIDVAGNIKYSPVVLMNGIKKLNQFSIVANPVQSTDLKISCTSNAKGEYVIRVFNAAGKSILSAKTQHAGGTTTFGYELPATATNGNYFLEIIDTKNTRQVLPFVVLNR